ncbi:helix-turn-helix domain-containing protein [Streptomyces sp. NPDC051773]|uniref:Helix-turn-helix domain-containing protein n=1 Tax=Streptomyces griseiscabiei TaxID=2993540 RepID=A0ABU4L7V0_9ACTN|nr:helix-turn-helix domain-containing protein [Streptomyces griseiscabiei]MDX2911842.1 helix-turn-helix domain-containing protein [Streptomyces griseiscabiei]
MASHPSRRLFPHVSGQKVTRHPGETTGTGRHDPRPLAALDPHGLLMLSHTLFTCAEQSEIVRLAMRHVSALGPYHAEAGYLATNDGLSRVPGHDAGAPTVDDTGMRELGDADGSVSLPERSWNWAFGLRESGVLLGYIVVSSRSEPDEHGDFLLATLVRLTSAALSLTVMSRLRTERDAALRQLDTVRSELHLQKTVHETLARVAARGGGEDAITQALYELTGLSALIEDRFGNLRSWAGPDRPDPYPVRSSTSQEEMLSQVAREAGPVRVKDRLIALARPRGDVLGVLAIEDPEATADEQTMIALDHAQQSLAQELVHMRELTEVELRLRRRLIDDLLEGTDETSAYARAEAVGHDLQRTHYVVVVRWPGNPTNSSFTRAVEQATATMATRPLITRRGDRMVLLTEARPDDDAVHAALAHELGTPDGAIGVSTRCDSPDGIPRCYQEALRALDVRQNSRQRSGTTFFDDLGLYRILGPGNDLRELNGFVREWLGRLIDYDAGHDTELVETLSRYFDCGGNYDDTAAALTVHRSTLRYRLQRIREISDRDLADVDTRLNLQVATRVWKIILGGRR